MTAVAVGPRSLVVLAGLPGAGKTTLLADLDTGGAKAVVLDSDQVRGSLKAALPRGLPYRCYRPLVHLLHRSRIAWAALSAPGLVLVHEPSTRATTRAALAGLGALTGRPRHFLWLDASPEEALEGQVERGRLVRSRSFARHVRRAERLRARLSGGVPPRGWQGLTVLTRGDRLRLSVPPR
ncbi:AAA family ATPase [Saccharothrix coeruleofusca]|uniref:ATP-binding protein n=1 Tax=Saccharothrix coeruleofusca TaxID=33919 RepID=A0A918EDF8_9PSEU|nr:AAA family ATPase [Saccharothrix coeruleofusca]GGP47704.1 ATP-binding protein [Saccharothrix coeruleofusca]